MSNSENEVGGKLPIVVLVEDEFLIRTLMAEVLAEAGFEVWEATHALEALALMEAHWFKVSLLFTDIHMPGQMDGIALVQHVSRNWPNVPLLLSSGKARLAAADLPPKCHFVPKPYDVQQTVERVRVLAAR